MNDHWPRVNCVCTLHRASWLTFNKIEITFQRNEQFEQFKFPASYKDIKKVTKLEFSADFEYQKSKYIQISCHISVHDYVNAL